jgi:hypothetical protein
MTASGESPCAETEQASIATPHTVCNALVFIQVDRCTTSAKRATLAAVLRVYG